MDDLTITKLCAETMEFDPLAINGVYVVIGNTPNRYLYNPLHDDAQAMALVKQFPIQCIGAMWEAVKSHNPTTQRFDLNRAICECVAKMQQAKG